MFYFAIGIAKNQELKKIKKDLTFSFFPYFISLERGILQSANLQFLQQKLRKMFNFIFLEFW